MIPELVPAQPDHVSELGRICFEAFKDIADRHGFSPDFPSVAVGRSLLGMLVQRDDFYSVTAQIDGQVVGSNFLTLMDVVAGVGPITVDLAAQGQGVGRALMQDVIDYAHRTNRERIRLLQDGFNMASLSLYASLGFEVKEAVALMQAVPAGDDDPAIRLITEADLPAIEELSTRIYKVSRSNEVAAASRYGFTSLLREREGHVAGYLIAGPFGHGVAESVEDALALTSEAARRLGGQPTFFFCPLSEADFYRKALQGGCRTIKVMNLMALGSYETPNEVWMPSVLY